MNHADRQARIATIAANLTKAADISHEALQAAIARHAAQEGEAIVRKAMAEQIRTQAAAEIPGQYNHPEVTPSHQ